MLYSFLRVIARLVLLIVNGKASFENKEKLPKGNYILVAPHRTWFDPIYLALAANPKRFTFMAKKELFNNKLLGWALHHVKAISVDRKHPGPSVIIKPVQILRKTDLSIIIFPSGTRHSEKLKSGAALIAKMAKVPLVPAVYQGPLTFKRLFSRKHVTVSFGDPIKVNPNLKLNEEGQAKVEKEMNDAFEKLDQEINPSFHYVDVSKK
ncbi:1-acyl-sn-glycerol-3-phosphate acyltransferase [Philodulcilactobacillus myokoensis]|uniref:1-acyl-sn-glycerol-3-phosphate acyltransferase n=1 Tax=Philodulcilactobacillus myokoensis TaxID=2929573 RepID=A0A9W6B140_9LACO|nr:1-acyl-sn-glycerol-3-phosphate acyltransferase [Philodulcilactobacillus myokoensis]GLB46960.1 1-acyl-sn-glycerol-3-phosphate acyltransferase [Philodulcilactobacillus myokoensis]